MAFLDSDGLPVFRLGSTTDGLDSNGEPVFGLPAVPPSGGVFGSYFYRQVAGMAG